MISSPVGPRSVLECPSTAAGRLRRRRGSGDPSETVLGRISSTLA
jgi:hypothetical protein